MGEFRKQALVKCFELLRERQTDQRTKKETDYLNKADYPTQNWPMLYEIPEVSFQNINCHHHPEISLREQFRLLQNQVPEVRVRNVGQMILNRIFSLQNSYGQSFGHEQPKSSVPLAASVSSGALICRVLPSASSLSLPLAAPSEWAYLYQPRGIHRAGVTKVCVSKKRASSLYSKYKIVIFNAPFQTTLQSQDFLISEPH